MSDMKRCFGGVVCLYFLIVQIIVGIAPAWAPPPHGTLPAAESQTVTSTPVRQGGGYGARLQDNIDDLQRQIEALQASLDNTSTVPEPATGPMATVRGFVTSVISNDASDPDDPEIQSPQPKSHKFRNLFMRDVPQLMSWVFMILFAVAMTTGFILKIWDYSGPVEACFAVGGVFAGTAERFRAAHAWAVQKERDENERLRAEQGRAVERIQMARDGDAKAAMAKELGAAQALLAHLQSAQQKHKEQKSKIGNERAQTATLTQQNRALEDELRDAGHFIETLSSQLTTLAQALHSGASADVLKTMTNTFAVTLAAMTQRRASRVTAAIPSTIHTSAQSLSTGGVNFDIVTQLANTLLRTAALDTNPDGSGSSSEEH